MAKQGASSAASSSKNPSSTRPHQRARGRTPLPATATKPLTPRAERLNSNDRALNKKQRNKAAASASSTDVIDVVSGAAASDASSKGSSVTAQRPQTSTKTTKQGASASSERSDGRLIARADAVKPAPNKRATKEPSGVALEVEAAKAKRATSMSAAAMKSTLRKIVTARRGLGGASCTPGLSRLRRARRMASTGFRPAPKWSPTSSTGGELPDWSKVKSFKDRLGKWSDALKTPGGNSRVHFFPIAEELNNLDDDWVPDEVRFDARFAESVGGLLQSGLSAEEIQRRLKNIIYIESGLKSGLCRLVYGGKSRAGGRRFIEHLVKLAEWLVSGLEGAPKHYQEGGRCERRVMVPDLRVSDELTEEEQGEGLAVHEAAVCWGVGSCTVREDMLEVRASYGGPSFPSILGIKSTQCFDAPNGRTNSQGVNKHGIQNCDYTLSPSGRPNPHSAEQRSRGGGNRSSATRPLTPGAS